MSDPTKQTLCVRCREHPASDLMDGLPTCRHCAELIRHKSETVRTCPVDGADMRKEIVQSIIIDRCPGCGGIWLDHDELEVLLRLAAEHSDQGFMNGVLLGLAW
jgi:hypothetical protein